MLTTFTMNRQNTNDIVKAKKEILEEFGILLDCKTKISKPSFHNRNKNPFPLSKSSIHK